MARLDVPIARNKNLGLVSSLHGMILPYGKRDSKSNDSDDMQVKYISEYTLIDIDN